MSPNDLEAQLPALATIVNELTAVQLAMLHQADRHQVGDPLGFASTAGWWAATTRVTKRDAHRQVALAARLDDTSHEPTGIALAAGAVSVEQATVILDAADALPAGLVDAELRRDAEQRLVGLAAHHDPKELRILGRRILDVLAPDISEEHERQLLETEERHAAATSMFTMRQDGRGSYVGKFKIPVLAGEILARHLHALASPHHRAAAGPRDDDPGARVARPLRLGQAFVEYLETRPTPGIPRAGGVPATIVVTMSLESLLGGAAAATLDSGERISASEGRRLACEAGLIPAVLGSPSQVLDLGRKTRFHTEPQRVAIALREDGRCIVEDCDWTADMCHVHHPEAWSKGGGTSVENGMLICPQHHTLAHDDRYQMKAAKNGRVTFSRRT